MKEEHDGYILYRETNEEHAERMRIRRIIAAAQKVRTAEVEESLRKEPKVKLRCAKCNEIVWPWQQQASFGKVGFRWWKAISRWHTSCLAISSRVHTWDVDREG